MVQFILKSQNIIVYYRYLYFILYIEKIPMLFIDVNLGEEKGGMKRLIIYEDDKCEELAEKFAINH